MQVVGVAFADIELALLEQARKGSVPLELEQFLHLAAMIHAQRVLAERGEWVQAVEDLLGKP